MPLDIERILFSMREEGFWADAWKTAQQEVQAAALEPLMPVIRRVILVGCGTSHYAGMYGRDMIEKWAGLPANVVDGNSGRYLEARLFTPDTLVIGISNTGNSGTAVETVERAARSGARTLSITGNRDSRIAAAADAILFFPGAMDTVATKTRSYVENLMVLLALAIRMGRLRGEDVPADSELSGHIAACGRAAARLFDAHTDTLSRLAAEYKDMHGMHAVGAGLNLCTAYEAGLKITEIGWFNCEAMELESYLHGKLRGADQKTPFFIIAPRDKSFRTAVNFVAVAKQVEAESIIVTDADFAPLHDLAKAVILVDPVWEPLTPMLYILPVYVFSLYLGIARGRENPAASQFGRPAQTIRLEELYPAYVTECEKL